REIKHQSGKAQLK
ncbi:hypothetical protein D043_3731B, partial [Vibrio parahaemolyticus EKP-021]